MPNIGTSIGGFFNSLVSGVGEAFTGATKIASQLAPAIGPGLELASGLGLIGGGGRSTTSPRKKERQLALQQQQQLALLQAQGRNPFVAGPSILTAGLTGGSPLARISTSPMSSQFFPTQAGAAAGVAGLARQLPALVGGAGAAFGLDALGDPSGGLRSPFGSSICISPEVTQSRMRMPTRFSFPDPTNPNDTVTYLRAPRVKYKVSVSSTKRRRCASGGR